jgi:hypothetical protein
MIAVTDSTLCVYCSVPLCHMSLLCTWSDNKVRELATVCLPWQHWPKALVWFDDLEISVFNSCVVDLWQSLSEWHLLMSVCVLVCCRKNVGASSKRTLNILLNLERLETKSERCCCVVSHVCTCIAVLLSYVILRASGDGFKALTVCTCCLCFISITTKGVFCLCLLFGLVGPECLMTLSSAWRWYESVPCSSWSLGRAVYETYR